MNFERNNRESIHRLTPSATFWDLCEMYETLYLCNDALNIVHIKEGDLIKFNLFMDGEVKRVYGMCSEIVNYNQTTFMICSHIDQNGEEFFLDYVYSSFLHAFVRLNHSGLFDDWSKLTFAKDAVTPEWFKEYWIANKAPNVTYAPKQKEDPEVSETSTDKPSKSSNDLPQKGFDQLVEEFVELECQLDRMKDKLKKYSKKSNELD
jgi:hypothetical protein